MNDLINPENHKEEDDGNKEKSEYSKKNIILSFLSYSFVFFLGIGISLLAGARFAKVQHDVVVAAVNIVGILDWCDGGGVDGRCVVASGIRRR